MSDLFTKIRCGLCGPGGLKCFCCNPTPHRGKNKKRMSRILKRRAKQLLKKQYDDETIEN